MKKLTKKTKIILLVIAIIIVSLIAVFVISKLLNKSDFHFKYASLDKVLESQEDVLGNKYDNLILPDKIAAVYPKKLYDYYSSGTKRDTSDEALDKAYSFINVFTGGIIEKSDIYIDDTNCFRFEPDEENGKNFIGFIDSNGMCDITSLEALDERANSTGVADTIYLRYGESADVTYDVCGEQYSVADAVAYCERYLEEINYLQYFDGNVELVPSFVQVTKTAGPNDFVADPDGPVMDTNYYYVFYDVYIDGVPLNDAGRTSYDNPYFLNTTLVLQVDKKDHIGNIVRRALMIPEEKTELKGRFVTLESALENVSKYLAKDHTYEVLEVGMRYASLVTLGTYDAPSEEHRKPYWRIVLSVADGEPNIPEFTARCAYVDMVSGEIYIYDDLSSQKLEPVELED